MSAYVRRLVGQGSRRVFFGAFVVFFGLSACWSLATPMFASPDETSHLVKAAATVRGEFGGRHGFVQQMMFQGPSEQPTRSYRVPAAYAVQVFPCYSFHPLLTPTCEKAYPEHPPSRTGSLTMWTTAGHYNPLYYGLVGWPSLVSKGVHGMYLIRLASSALNSLLLAAAVTIAAGWRRPGFLLAGMMTAVTPMALFLGATVNPNGLEISSAVLAWVAALSLALQPDPGLLRRRVIAFVAAAAVLVNVRPLGYEWLAAILAVACFVAAKGSVKAVLRCRTTWRALPIAAPAFVFGLLWTLNNGDNAKVPFVPSDAFIPAAHSMLDGMTWEIQCMIAEFGWLDTPAPAATYYLWTGVTLLLALVAMAAGKWRQTTAVLAVGVGVVAIPMLAQGYEARHIGMVWQGRYLLAFAVGLPLLAGAVLAVRVEEAALPRRADGRMVLTLGVTLAFAEFIAYFHALRRYMVGLNGRLLFAHITWEPWGTWLLWVPLYAAVLAAFVAFFVRLAQLRRTEVSDQGMAGESEPAGPRARIAGPRIPRISWRVGG